MMKSKNQSCIDACLACAIVCASCESACLQESDVAMMARCIELDRQCSAICYLSADSIAQNSEFMTQICALCADICDACREECAKHSYDHCQDCAVACKKCADECRKWVAGHS